MLIAPLSVRLKKKLKMYKDDFVDVKDTGTDVILNGTGDLPMSVDVGGNSIQEQYEGYNLLENTATSQKISGVDFTVNEDKTILVNGTASADITNYTIGIFVPTINQPYFISGCPSGGSTSSYYIRGNTWALNDTGNGFSFTSTSGNPSLITINIKSGTVCNNLLFKPMIVKGTEAKDYEPYVGGQASPSPEYKQDINNVEGDVEVKAGSRNIFDEEMELGSINGANGSNDSSTSVIRTINYTDVSKFRKIAVILSDNSIKVCGYRFYDNEKRYLGSFSVTNNAIIDLDIISLSNKTQYYSSNADIVYIRFVITNSTDLSIKYGIMVDSNTYVPHAENSVTFPLQEGQKMYINSYLADDGIHHKRKQYVFTGNELISKNSASITNSLFYVYDISKNININKLNKSICNFFTLKGLGTLNNSNEEGFTFSVLGGRIIFYFNIKTEENTVEAVKNYLAEQYSNGTPVIVEYELEEEEIEPYTTEQKTAYKKLKEMQSYYDLTYVSGSSDNAQPILTAHAKKSLKVMQNEIDNIKALILES